MDLMVVLLVGAEGTENYKGFSVQNGNFKSPKMIQKWRRKTIMQNLVIS